MIWQAITLDQVGLTPEEVAAMQRIAQSQDRGAQMLQMVVAEFLDAIRGVTEGVPNDGTIPDRIRLHVLNRTRWLWLCEFPQMKAWQTDVRKQQNDEAQEMLRQISAGEIAIIPPGASTEHPRTGNWNSENRVDMRKYPAPRPRDRESTENANPAND